MSASGNPESHWSAFPVREGLARLESRWRELQREHDLARTRLDRMVPAQTDGLRAAWRDYCEVVAELDEAAAELQQLRAARD